MVIARLNSRIGNGFIDMLLKTLIKNTKRARDILKKYVCIEIIFNAWDNGMGAELKYRLYSL